MSKNIQSWKAGNCGPGTSHSESLIPSLSMAVTAILGMESIWVLPRIRMSLSLFLIDGMQGRWMAWTLIPLVRVRAWKEDILRV